MSITSRGSFHSAMQSWAIPRPSNRALSPSRTHTHITYGPTTSSPTRARHTTPSAPNAISTRATTLLETSETPTSPPKTRRRSPGKKPTSSLHNTSRPTSPRQSVSPGRTTRRSFGADTYSEDFVRRKSMGTNKETTDCNTEVVGVIGEHDPRCTLVTSHNLVWIAERDGSISITKMDGVLVHIIDRHAGSFVTTMIEVGPTVWVGCTDGFVRIMSKATFLCHHHFACSTGGGGSVTSLCYHDPSNVVFSGSNTFQILAWDATKFALVKQLSPPHSGSVNALAIHHNTLYSASDDRTIAMWDVSTSQKVGTLSGHTAAVRVLCLTDKFLWSGSDDSTIRIWNLATGACVGVAEALTGGVQVLSTIGDKVWSGAGDTICIWDAAKLVLDGTYTVHSGYVNTILPISKKTEVQVWTASSDNQLKLWRTRYEEANSTDGESKESAPLRPLEELESLAQANRQLLASQASSQSEVAALKHDLATTIERYESQLRSGSGSASHVKELTEENRRLHADYTQLYAENRRMLQDLALAREEAALAREEASRVKIEVDKVHLDWKASEVLWADKVRELTLRAEDFERMKTEAILQAQIQMQKELEASQAHVHALQAENVALGASLAALDAEKIHMETELNQMQDEVDTLNKKCLAMDVMFKSRLSLITDVFKLYKRLERGEKASKSGNSAQSEQELHSILHTYKTLISNHFTDDELNHLGSSRHFFTPEALGIGRIPSRR